MSVPARPVPAPARTDQAVIRNFCIIAHIDHGKSTLADRMLQLTGIVEGRQMRAQYLDRMDIERERGITIKSQAVRLPWKQRRPGLRAQPDRHARPRRLHLRGIAGASPPARAPSCWSTPRRASRRRRWPTSTWRSTLTCKIIPVLNKIDLPAAQPERYAEELAAIIGCDPSEVMRVSAKTGEGVEELLDTIVEQVPPPTGDPDAPAQSADLRLGLRHLPRRCHLRAGHGRHLSKRERMLMMSTQAVHETLELGVISPEPIPADGLGAGEVGYLITGVKDVRQARVGDTITSASKPAQRAARRLRPPQADGVLRPLPGRRRRVPGTARRPRQAQLNDAALVYEPETSHRARLRLPLRLPRPAAHGDRQGAARARVRPVASSPPRRTSSTASSWRAAASSG